MLNPEDKREYIGIDLDRTLCFYDKWKGHDFIGKPVPLMLKRVKNFLKRGERVVIFTARATDLEKETIIQNWLQKVGLPKLEVTNIKSPLMKKFFDDRAQKIIPNKGITFRQHFNNSLKNK